MKQGSCNGNNLAWLWCDNALVRGPQHHLIYYICHWILVFNFWKHQNPFFIFHHPHPKFWVFWVLEIVIQNQVKQFVIRGTHSVWMMDHENGVISLNFHDIQTSSNQSKFGCLEIGPDSAIVLAPQSLCDPRYPSQQSEPTW